jgi:hypothetical protein
MQRGEILKLELAEKAGRGAEGKYAVLILKG